MTPDLQKLWERLRLRPDTDATGPATPEELSSLETQTGLRPPEIYLSFLSNFGFGGEFCFARMRELEDEAVDAFWEHSAEVLGPKASERYLPFGEDYSGNWFCFDLGARHGNDCRVVLVDSSWEDQGRPDVTYPGMAALIEEGLNQAP